MTPVKKKRLATIVFILVGMSLATALLFTALGSNMNHYYELSAIKAGEVQPNQHIRIGGLVEKGSIKRHKDSLDVVFNITDLSENITVKYTGILPDLFREGQGVLVKGRLVNKNNFEAESILAKHDENYMPKEVREELEKNELYKYYGESATEQPSYSN